MNRRLHSVYWVLIPLLLLAWSSCSNTKRLAKGKPLRQFSPGHIIKENAASEFDFEYIGMKLNADLFSGDKKNSFKATIRMKRDSIIWISISPALGVEVVRMIITPDSVKYVSKIPGDKHYYLGDFSVIRDVANMDLDFRQIQDILVGNAVFLDKQEDKFESQVDDQQYLLVSKVDRKLKKLIEKDEKDILPDDAFTVNGLSKEYQKIKRRASEEELMLKRFWLNGLNFKLERVLINDFFHFRDMEIAYNGWKDEDGQWFPEEGRLTVTDYAQGKNEIGFKVGRVKVNKAYDFPFNIPDDFERRLTP